MENKKVNLLDKLVKTIKTLITPSPKVLTATTAKTLTEKQYNLIVARIIKEIEHDIETKVRALSITEKAISIVITKDLFDLYGTVQSHFKEVGFGTSIYDNSTLPELGEHRLLLISW